ncbi:MAG TPA: hypothetical protein DEB47_07135 [Citreicella sp.]|nr:hypothetical protein [Citreicella sp.]|tara:strand:- start:68 stop:334 length:267 start_codon:yes stop_codon:yes gene_type:complete
MKFILPAIACTVLLSGCETPPAVVDFNGNSVTIQQTGYNAFSPEADAEASRLCATEGRKAERGSMRAAPDTKGLVAPVINYLYICVPK